MPTETEDITDVLSRLTDLLGASNGSTPNGSTHTEQPNADSTERSVDTAMATLKSRQRVAQQYLYMAKVPELTQGDIKRLERWLLDALKEIATLKYRPSAHAEAQALVAKAFQEALHQLKTVGEDELLALILTMLEDAGLLDDDGERFPAAVPVIAITITDLAAKTAMALGAATLLLGAAEFGYEVGKDYFTGDGAGNDDRTPVKPGDEPGERQFMPVPGQDDQTFPIPGAPTRPPFPSPWPLPDRPGLPDSMYDGIAALYPRADVQASIAIAAAAIAAVLEDNPEIAEALNELTAASEIAEAVSLAGGNERAPQIGVLVGLGAAALGVVAVGFAAGFVLAYAIHAKGKAPAKPTAGGDDDTGSTGKLDAGR
ncbi:MAG: hypothetical protein AAGC53_09145 [Actinomycetota bacterium]